MLLIDAEQHALDAVDTMAPYTPDHQARFCGIWKTVGPLLDELKGLIPGFGPLIIGALVKIGDKIYDKHGCGDAGGDGPAADDAPVADNAPAAGDVPAVDNGN